MLDLQQLLKAAYELKPLSPSVTRLAQLVANPNSSMKDIVTVISYDQALTVKVLRAANAAINAPRNPITTVQAAAVRIGTGSVLTLAMSSGIKGYVQKAVPEYGLSEGQLWHHSVAAAVAAETMRAFCDAPVPPESFTAALLHDIGKLILGRFLDSHIAKQLSAQGQMRGLTGMEAERKILGVHHGDVGGLIARKWQLPKSIVQGIVHHHMPENAQNPVSDVVHMADLIADAVDDPSQPRELPEHVEFGCLERLAFRIDGYSRLVERVAQRKNDLMAIYNA